MSPLHRLDIGALTGEQLGDYTLERELGRGSFGVVYLAKSQGRELAIKVLQRDYMRDPQLRKRLEREVDTLSKLASDRAISMLQSGFDARLGVAYVVMERLEGQSLEEVLREKGHLSVDATVELAAEIAEAVAYVHSCGIIHRDLKPEHVWLVPTPAGGTRVKLIDFGISKDLTRTGLTQKGGPGTPAYMAPEQFGGERGPAEVTPATDIWALGVMLHVCLTGVNPFERDEVMQTMTAIATLDPQLPESVPAPLAALVSECLRKEKRARAQSAADLAARLRAMAAGAGASPPARRVAPTQLDPVTRDADGRLRSRIEVPPSTSPTGPPRARGWGLWLVAILAALSMLVLGLYWRGNECDSYRELDSLEAELVRGTACGCREGTAPRTVQYRTSVDGLTRWVDVTPSDPGMADCIRERSLLRRSCVRSELRIDDAACGDRASEEERHEPQIPEPIAAPPVAIPPAEPPAPPAPEHSQVWYDMSAVLDEWGECDGARQILEGTAARRAAGSALVHALCACADGPARYVFVVGPSGAAAGPRWMDSPSSCAFQAWLRSDASRCTGYAFRLTASDCEP